LYGGDDIEGNLYHSKIGERLNFKVDATFELIGGFG
jgi:hypothetical protein